MKQEIKKYSDEKTVRIVQKDDATKKFCLIDIARCVGYKAPSKFATRCIPNGERLPVKWKHGNRAGHAKMYCVSIDEYMEIAERYMFPKDFTNWILSQSKGEKSIMENFDKKLIKNNHEDIETSYGMLIDMLNNMMYACLELKKEIELMKTKEVYTIK